MQLEKNSTLLFIGDSITDCGRARPVGEKDGLGNGYVAQINAILNATHPDRSIRVLNTGISGNRVCDLKGRWQPDVLGLNPDWLSIMIGINDVWRQFDNPFNPRQVDLVEYEDTLKMATGASLNDALLPRGQPSRPDAKFDGSVRAGGEESRGGRTGNFRRHPTGL